jgi:hypothetical protein
MNKDSRIVKILTCIGECCLACLERFLNFVNKNAYIQTAIEGSNYCTGAVAAFNLLLRNFLRLGAITFVSTIFLQAKIFYCISPFTCLIDMLMTRSSGSCSSLSSLALSVL